MSFCTSNAVFWLDGGGDKADGYAGEKKALMKF